MASITPFDRPIVQGRLAARNVHLACFCIRYLAGMKGENEDKKRSGRSCDRLLVYALALPLFHNQLAAQHAHLALEAILAGLVGRKLHVNLFTFWQFGALVEIGKEHHLRAG